MSVVKYALKKLNAMMWAGTVGVRINLDGPSKYRNEVSLLKRRVISSVTDKVLTSHKGNLYYI